MAPARGRAAGRSGWPLRRGHGDPALRRALTLNIHVHSLVRDGGSTRPSSSTPPTFHAPPPPTDADLAELLARLEGRVRRLLDRRGRLPADAGATDPFAAQEPRVRDHRDRFAPD